MNKEQFGVPFLQVRGTIDEELKHIKCFCKMD